MMMKEEPRDDGAREVGEVKGFKQGARGEVVGMDGAGEVDEEEKIKHVLRRRLREGNEVGDKKQKEEEQLPAPVLEAVQAHEEGDLFGSMHLVAHCLRLEMFAASRALLETVLQENDKRVHGRDLLLHLNVQFQLGVLLFDNLCPTEDPAVAEKRGLELMQIVAEADPSALREPKDGGIVDAMQLTTSALFNIGCAYFHGTGVTRNLDRAVGHWKLAAKDGTYHGSDQAMNMLGIFYSNSYRVSDDDALVYTKPDLEEAFSWHTCAHKNGNVDSTCRLGLMYQKGQGCQQHDRQALDFLKKAAMAGHDMAETALCIHYYNMRLFHKSVQWARRVVRPLQEAEDLPAIIATQSHDVTKAQATCCWYLSQCYADGTGVPAADKPEAHILFSLALRIHEPTVLELEKQAKQAKNA